MLNGHFQMRIANFLEVYEPRVCHQRMNKNTGLLERNFDFRLSGLTILFFRNSWDDDPIWLILVRGAETTNQYRHRGLGFQGFRVWGFVVQHRWRRALGMSKGMRDPSRANVFFFGEHVYHVLQWKSISQEETHLQMGHSTWLPGMFQTFHLSSWFPCPPIFTDH